MIEFTCPCGQALEAEDEDAGLRTRCPVCGATPTVPARTAVTSQAPAGDAWGGANRRDEPRATSGKAIGALVCGLLSFGFLCLTGIPAFVLGALALMDIAKSNGRLSGRVLAVAGMILSALSLLCVGPAAIFGLYQAVGLVRGAADRKMSQNNLHQMAIAMHSHHDANGYLPPAQGFAPPGMGVPGPGFPGPPGAPGQRPKVSWRVLILPYIEQGNLYQMYNFNEPWDGPNNSKLLTMMPKVYQLPGDTTAPPGHTYYQVFVSSPAASPHALFSTAPGEYVRIADIKDGSSNTLMIVEAATPVPWTKPDDIAFDPNGPLPRLGTHYNGGCNAAFADGAVRFLPGNLSPATLKALITRDGGEIVSVPDY